MHQIQSAIERQYIVSANDNPKVIKPPRPNKPPKHPSQHQDHFDAPPQNYNQQSTASEEILSKYQEKIRTQAKRIMELEKKVSALVNTENYNSNQSENQISNLLDENQALKGIVTDLEARCNSLQDNPSNSNANPNFNEDCVFRIRELETEKSELEATLKSECINSEKMRTHIEWLTDIAENRLKSIGFISTIE